MPLNLWLKFKPLRPKQIHEDALSYELRPGKGRKRKAEAGLKVCAEDWSARSIARASDLLEGLQPGLEGQKPTVGSSKDGNTFSQALSGTGQATWLHARVRPRMLFGPCWNKQATRCGDWPSEGRKWSMLLGQTELADCGSEAAQNC